MRILLGGAETAARAADLRTALLRSAAAPGGTRLPGAHRLARGTAADPGSPTFPADRAAVTGTPDLRSASSAVGRAKRRTARPDSPLHGTDRPRDFGDSRKPAENYLRIRHPAKVQATSDAEPQRPAPDRKCIPASADSGHAICMECSHPDSVRSTRQSLMLRSSHAAPLRGGVTYRFKSRPLVTQLR